VSEGTMNALLEAVTTELGTDADLLRTSGRQAHVSLARRVAVLACRMGHRPIREVCAVLCISDSAGSYLIRTADQHSLDAARRVALRWSQRG
jgi:hypothetical protein